MEILNLNPTHHPTKETDHMKMIYLFVLVSVQEFASMPAVHTIHLDLFCLDKGVMDGVVGHGVDGAWPRERLSHHNQKGIILKRLEAICNCSGKETKSQAECAP